MKGYVNDADATNSTIDKDGWLHSGDIAYYSSDKQVKTSNANDYATDSSNIVELKVFIPRKNSFTL